MTNYHLMHGDCLEELPKIPNDKIDMVLADLPYGITQNDWDQELSLGWLWDEYKRVSKDTAVIVLTGSQPFTSKLILSNEEMFRHEWIWRKNRGSNFANTVREPFKEHEQVLIFSEGNWTYNPIMESRKGHGKDLVGKSVNVGTEPRDGMGEFQHHNDIDELSEKREPSSVQKFNVEVGLHPTQKPVSLFEYLIKTYTNKGDIVLDNVMGSGTTGVACQKTNRKFIGIELNDEYFETAEQRIEEAKNTDWERVRAIDKWQQFNGIGDKTAQNLYDHLGKLKTADLSELESVSGIGEKTANKIREEAE